MTWKTVVLVLILCKNLYYSKGQNGFSSNEPLIFSLLKFEKPMTIKERGSAPKASIEEA